jgi:CheY-like chemotaxis protein
MAKPYSFILIDDDPISNQLTEIQIKRVFPDAKITCFSDPREAIYKIEHSYIDYPENTTIFLDINMPYSGWRVLEAFEKHPAVIHEWFIIYILTSSSDEGDELKAKRFPLVKACLQKPVTKQDLLDMFG